MGTSPKKPLRQKMAGEATGENDDYIIKLLYDPFDFFCVADIYQRIPVPESH